MARKRTIKQLEKRFNDLEKEALKYRQIQDSLRESEEKFRNLAEQSPDMIFINKKGRIVYANKKCEEITGYKREEFYDPDFDFRTLIAPQSKDVIETAFKKHMQGEEVDPYEYTIKTRDGGRIEAINVAKLMIYEGESAILGIVTDITERNRAERELQESEERYRSLVENSLSAIILYRQEEILFANRPFFEIFGYERNELKNLVVDDILAPEVAADVAERRRQRIAGEIDQTAIYESRGKRKNGEIFEMEISVCVVSYKGEPCCMASLSDISRRKQAEEALRESESRFRNLFELSPQAIALAEVETGKIIDVNDKCCELTKYSKNELIGHTSTEIGLYSKRERNRFIEILQASGEVQGLEMDFKTKDGSIIHTLMFSKIITISGKPLILTILFDITERIELETQLQHAHKMEAIGTLAGGIAHDFNNLLMAIQGNSSLILSDIDDTHEHYEKIKNIEKLVKSGAKLTGQLLGYARKGRYEIKPIHLNQIVEETANAFGSARKEILIHLSLKEDLFAIEADQGQIEQVLLNFFVNAADAMPGGGDLFIETKNVNHTHIKDKPYKPKPGSYVFLTITDTGSGMDKETLERIFEPFFTTKKMGSGVGLGLASAYGIVKAHGGYIDVESEEGRGTTFSIYLPAIEKMVKRAVEKLGKSIKGSETILLVDDEGMVLEAGIMMLKHLGYRVFDANSGREALAVYEENRDTIDLVILDMIMPDIGGGETYDRLKKINPDVRVLLSSGYSIDGQAQDILNRGCNGFIQKPYNVERFSRSIREVFKAD